MKQLTCEMCGSIDLIKQDGVFVCQACGTKYSIEEAKKMMVEGTVEVAGTVKVDTSDELSNLYLIARRAKDEDNIENAAKYYDMILIKDPTSWEANFYSVYYKAMTCRVIEISTAATNVGNCIKATFQLILDYVQDSAEKKDAIVEVKDRAQKISQILFNAASSHFNSIGSSVNQSSKQQYLLNIVAAEGIEKSICDNLCNIFSDDEDVMRTVGIQILKDRIAKGIANSVSSQYAQVIQKYEPTYQAPINKTFDQKVDKLTNSLNSSSGGCYVATAVYGSYDCPQVWTLRRYRDYKLAETWYGRTFIHFYYAISPTFVKWFGHTGWFKKMWKGKLDRLVAKLQSKGVESTPYEDRRW